MTPQQILDQLTDNQRTTMLILWRPTDVTTIDSHDANQLQAMGLVTKQENGLFGFTELGQQVCQLIPDDAGTAQRPQSPFH